MTDTVEAIVAEMRSHLESGCACCQSAEFLDRLQSAHAAERQRYTELEAMYLRQGSDFRKEMVARESVESRLREAERDARRYHRTRAICCGDIGPTIDLAMEWQTGDEAAMDAAIDADPAFDRAMEGEDG